MKKNHQANGGPPKRPINVLILTLNSALRSTTCVLDALFKTASKEDLNPIIVFNDSGTWETKLKETGYRTYIYPLRAMEKNAPLRSLRDLLFWCFLIIRHRIDIIHINEHENFLAIRLAAKLMRTPALVFNRFVVGEGYAHWLYPKRFTPDRLLFTSEDQLARTLPGLPKHINTAKLLVFGNGRDLDSLINSGFTREAARALWQFNLKESTIVLGTASTIRPRKRLEDFILLIKELRGKGYVVKGLVAGGGKFGEPEYLAKLHQIVREEKLEQEIKFVGNVENMAPFYKAIDIFISTSELETFGLSVCEAMAFSIPVLGYEGGSIQEVIQDTRCIAKNLDLAELTHKVAAILDSPLLAKEIAERGKARVFSLFNAPRLSEKLIDTYREVLDYK